MLYIKKHVRPPLPGKEVFWPKAPKNRLCQSPLQELEEGPHIRLYLLVYIIIGILYHMSAEVECCGIDAIIRIFVRLSVGAYAGFSSSI